MDDKQHAREAALAARDRIPPADRLRRSAEACRKLESHFAPLLQPGSLLAVYAAMKSEVDLRALVDAAHARGWRVCFPCMTRDAAAPFSPARMEFHCVEPAQLAGARAGFLAHPLRTWPSGSLEREGYSPVEPSQIDGVVVPLVAFDAAGRRLGYGGGNYDRLLASLRPDAAVAGVAFAEQRLARVPTEPHDRPLPTVIVA